MKHILFLLLLLSFFCGRAKGPQQNKRVDITAAPIFADNRPWTRWWWFASEVEPSAIRDNLIWLKQHGFGGVEIAWVYPRNRMQKDTVHYTPRQPWLSPEWSRIVHYAKHAADSLGLGCDFTFGSLWPFGDLKVPRNEATRNWKDTTWRQEISASWDYPRKGYVLDHLSREAFNHYAQRMGEALRPALAGSLSGLFCDSWEVETRYLTTPGFEKQFEKQFGYSLLPFRDSLYAQGDPYRQVRYDYMKLISQLVINQFYIPFNQKCHELGAYSRVQCSGAPCDILSAYGVVDVPESEALLYEPSYSNIVASAAALTGKRVVTAESFTCLYGWPRIHHSEEQTADLKLLADALLANGVNKIIWHGKPLNPAGVDSVKFYASVHVGESGALAPEITAFNCYLEQVSGAMKGGATYSKVAVYLPTEDRWIAGELPPEKQLKWAWGAYEHRDTYLPKELQPWRPLWINGEFLRKATCKDHQLKIGDLSFEALYLDVHYLDLEALSQLVTIAQAGVPICLKQVPRQPGYHRSATYQRLLEQLQKRENVYTSWDQIKTIPPLVSGAEKVDYWCRTDGDQVRFFFANPKAYHLTFPLEYGQSLNNATEERSVVLQVFGQSIPVNLIFHPYHSLLVTVGRDRTVKVEEFTFVPQQPVFRPRVKIGRDPWEIESK